MRAVIHDSITRALSQSAIQGTDTYLSDGTRSRDGSPIESVKPFSSVRATSDSVSVDNSKRGDINTGRLHAKNDGDLMKKPTGQSIPQQRIVPMSSMESLQSSTSIQTAIYNPLGQQAAENVTPASRTAELKGKAEDNGPDFNFLSKGESSSATTRSSYIAIPSIRVHGPLTEPVKHRLGRIDPVEVVHELRSQSMPESNRGTMHYKTPQHSNSSSGNSSQESERSSIFSPAMASPDSYMVEAAPSPGMVVKPRSESMRRSPTTLHWASLGPSVSGSSLRSLRSQSMDSGRAKVVRFAVPDHVSPNESSSPAPTFDPKRFVQPQRPRSPSEASISREVRRTRLSGGRFEPHDVRRLDGIEVADGIKLATQNTDGQPVPEMEADEVNELPAPPGAHEDVGVRDAISDLGISTPTDRMRAASPPPPPNYDPEHVRRIRPRLMNRGWVLSQPDVVNGDEKPSMARVKEGIATVAHTIMGKAQSENETQQRDSPNPVPEPDIKGPGSIPESAVVGPSRSQTSDSPYRSSSMHSIRRLSYLKGKHPVSTPHGSSQFYETSAQGDTRAMKDVSEPEFGAPCIVRDGAYIDVDQNDLSETNPRTADLSPGEHDSPGPVSLRSSAEITNTKLPIMSRTSLHEPNSDRAQSIIVSTNSTSKNNWLSGVKHAWRKLMPGTQHYSNDHQPDRVATSASESCQISAVPPDIVRKSSLRA